MSIIKELFWEYLEGRLPVKPEISGKTEEDKISEFERFLGLSDEQVSSFEDFLFDYSGSLEKQGFSAGFRLAFELIWEIFEIPLDKSPQK